MSASNRLLPFLLAGGVGVAGGLYIWQKPLQEVSGKSGSPGEIKDGRSQSAKDGSANGGAPLRHGGSQSNDLSEGNVAGASSSARLNNTVDRNTPTRSNPKEQDGTSGGGVGVAEMRERKMDGKGLPSPQGGDTKAQPAKAQKPYSEH